MMMKRRKHFFKNMSMMGMNHNGMGMNNPNGRMNNHAPNIPAPNPAPNPTPIGQNPIILLDSFPPFSETSIVDQNMSVVLIKNNLVTSVIQPEIANSSFTLVVNVAIYAPNKSLNPIHVYDSTTPNNNGKSNTSRTYMNAFQYGFGKGKSAYQHAMFYLNNIPAIQAPLYVTVNHPFCKRRIITVDYFANIDTGNPTDQLSAHQSQSQGITQISSGLTNNISQPLELAYGSIAIGRSFNQYNPPENFIPIQSVGSSIDDYDVTLNTYYQLTSQIEQCGVSAMISSTDNDLGDFVWSAATQTFKAM